MKKLSFKTKESKRQTIIELEIDEKILEVTFTTPTIKNVGGEALIIDMFKSMLRLDKNKKIVFDNLTQTLDVEQIMEIISAVNEELYLKKK